MARIFVVETVGAATAADDVAKRVENGKGIVVLQDSGARLAEPAGRLDPVLRVVFARLCYRSCHYAAPVPRPLSRQPE
jgi:hypothetical protein